MSNMSITVKTNLKLKWQKKTVNECRYTLFNFVLHT